MKDLEREFPNPTFLILYYPHNLHCRSSVVPLNAWRPLNTLPSKTAYEETWVIKTFPRK